MEIGQVIGGHYLLQRLIQQGPYSTVFQGVDQSFQRVVAVKAVSAAYIPMYRAAVRKTSQLSYPHITMLYDLVIEPDRLYLVEEYVEGDDFATLLQAQLQPFDVAEYGRQICSALLYASSPTRRICHGDLTPRAILRDRRGLIRVNNFALPTDMQYFAAWSKVGGEGRDVADTDMPWGTMSPGRQDDDTRAVGLLLYQLLAGRSPNATMVEPPVDGRLRFMRNIPPELCELVARTVMRDHPQHITTAEVLHDELTALTEALDPSSSMAAANVPIYQPAEAASPRQYSTAAPGGKMMNPLPAGQPGRGLSSYQQENSVKVATPALDPVASAAPTTADASLLVAPMRQPDNYLTHEETPAASRNSSLLWWLLLGLVAFVLFFVVGYYAGILLIHP
ncbi:MAG: protein kinase [Ktedonobacteraceae bacterium]